MLVSSHSRATRRALLLLSIRALLFQHQLIVYAQVVDGDDQFQAYHQDIGRISGGAQVAPNTVVRQISSPPVPAAVQRLPASSQQSRTSRRPAIGQAVRSASAPRQRPAQPATPAAPVFETSNPDFAASVQPTFTQLAAPPQHTPFQPLTTVPEPAEGPLVVRPVHNLASASLRSSVSARHSALMAQVAAERQAAASAAANTGLPLEPLQPSLGSPLVALSQPQASLAAPSQTVPTQFVDQPEEPLVAPSFEHVLSNGCPYKGVFSYPNKDHCDRYYICTNGTFTEEACPNGLSYGTMGAVYQHCAYNWNIDCGHKKTAEPISSPGCPWQFGIFPVTGPSKCSLDYFVCEWGVPERKRCQPEGLFYDDRIKGCQWADQLGCKSEQVLNFKCPAEDEDNPYWPYPRYYHTKQDVVVCVNEQPRLVHCNEDQIVDPNSLACMDLHKKKKKPTTSFRV